MSAFIDLHSHWVAGIDDGAKQPEEGLELLRALASIGFCKVIATPHMRPGMFDNNREQIHAAFERMRSVLEKEAGLPEVGLGCEHFFDGIVFERIMNGLAVPYPGDKAILIEFPSDALPARVADRLFDVRRKGLRPVLAHPERYMPVWKHTEPMADLVDRGTVLLMDIAALVGQYGRAPRKAAETMLEEGLYYAACSDAHRVGDVEAVAEGIRKLRALVGDSEAQFLLEEGPRAILEGRVEL